MNWDKPLPLSNALEPVAGARVRSRLSDDESHPCQSPPARERTNPFPRGGKVRKGGLGLQSTDA